jgi:hypothetical protein
LVVFWCSGFSLTQYDVPHGFTMTKQVARTGIVLLLGPFELKIELDDILGDQPNIVEGELTPSVLLDVDEYEHNFKMVIV